MRVLVISYDYNPYNVYFKHQKNISLNFSENPAPSGTTSPGYVQTLTSGNKDTESVLLTVTAEPV